MPTIPLILSNMVSLKDRALLAFRTLVNRDIYSQNNESGIRLSEIAELNDQLAPVMRNVPPAVKQWWSTIGLQHTFRPNESLAKYGENVWTYGAITTIAYEIGQTDFFIARESKNGEVEQISNHQAIATLNKPMQIKDRRSHLTGMTLKMLTTQHLLLNGEAFWVMDQRIPMVNSPMMLFPLIPSGVSVELDSMGFIKQYKYRTQTDEMLFDAQDVVHFKLPSPDDFYRGHSPMKSMWNATETYKKADELNFFRFANMAIPAGLLKTDKAVAQKERRKIIKEFVSLFGGVRNTNKPGFLPYGIGYEKIQESNADMQYGEGKNINRDEILGNLRVGLEMLGKTESQTRANADASNYVFQRFNIKPFLSFYADTLTNDYLSAFAGVLPNDYIGFPNPVPEDAEAERENDDLMMRHGAMTIDELRMKRGMKPLNIKGVTDVPQIPMDKIANGDMTIDPNGNTP